MMFLDAVSRLLIPGAAVLLGLVALFDGTVRVGRQTVVPSRGWGAAAVAFGLFLMVPVTPLARPGGDLAPATADAGRPQAAACRNETADNQFYLTPAAAAGLPASPPPCTQMQGRIDAELARLGYPAQWIRSTDWPEKERLARSRVPHGNSKR